MREEEGAQRHWLTLEGRGRLTAAGISEVEGFDDETIEAVTPLGILMVKGRGLKVEKFSVETGDLTVAGEVTALAYSEDIPRKAGIFAKIFR